MLHPKIKFKISMAVLFGTAFLLPQTKNTAICTAVFVDRTKQQAMTAGDTRRRTLGRLISVGGLAGYDGMKSLTLPAVAHG